MALNPKATTIWMTGSTSSVFFIFLFFYCTVLKLSHKTKTRHFITLFFLQVSLVACVPVCPRVRV